MLSFLNKIKIFFSSWIFDATIIGGVNFNNQKVPYFIVKMRGCQTLVDINAEDIVEKFTSKFSQLDIKNATKIMMKYRSKLHLVSINRNYAILCDKTKNDYQLVDLCDNLLPKTLDFDELLSVDAFNIGMHFERIRYQKERRLFHLTKVGKNVTQLKLVKHNE